MNPVILLLSVIACLAFLYEALLYFYIQKLKKKLRHGNLFAYKDKLGYHYKYHVRSSGGIHCKWRKRWVTVKASFDENSKLLNYEIIPSRLSNIVSCSPLSKLSMH